MKKTNRLEPVLDRVEQLRCIFEASFVMLPVVAQVSLLSHLYEIHRFSDAELDWAAEIMGLEYPVDARETAKLAIHTEKADFN